MLGHGRVWCGGKVGAARRLQRSAFLAMKKSQSSELWKNGPQKAANGSGRKAKKSGLPGFRSHALSSAVDLPIECDIVSFPATPESYPLDSISECGTFAGFRCLTDGNNNNNSAQQKM